MNDVDFKMDYKAFGEQVMKADWMLNLTIQKAQKIAGKDTHLKSFIGFDRASTIIYPNTKEYPS